MLAHLAGGVPVEGRSEGPPIAHPQGPVVPRVVVAVSRKDVERHPPEQLRQVISDPLGRGVHADRHRDAEEVGADRIVPPGQGQG
jgi:hypothetical protein